MCFATYLAMQDMLQEKVTAWRSQLLKGSLELAILLALRKKPRYGLELVELCNRVGLGISDGSIYPLLSRLKAENKVQAEWIDEGSGHAHKYYRITDYGKATCKVLLETWQEFTKTLQRLIEEQK